MHLFHLLLIALLCTAFLLTGCAGSGAPGNTDPSAPSASPSDPSGTPAPTDVIIPAPPEDTEPPPPFTATPPETLKVLAIGGSFSIDAMEYLYQIAQAGGVKEIVLGNLYYGGASLSRHLNMALSDTAGYSYYKNSTGTWTVSNNYALSQALADEEWDYITVQQVSTSSGMSYTYEETLSDLLDFLRGQNSTAKLVWHMTWAYQQDYDGGGFSRYGNDQQNMYNLILECVNEWVIPEERISFVIPAGTAIQNARTSFIGDTLTRDGLHLDYHIGRYIAALTWYAAITNAPIDNIDYNPSESKISPDMLAAAREAVKNAILTPCAVTQSTITEGSRP